MLRASGEPVNSHDDRIARVDAFVRLEAPRVLAYFERRADFQEEAADLLSDTLLVVWRRSDALPVDDQQARMWLFGIARKVLLGYRRGTRRRSELGARLRAEIELSQPDDPIELRTELRDALDSLADLDREIVILTVWDGFSQAEIARQLGMRAGTVRSRYTRARARLRSVLSEESREVPIANRQKQNLPRRISEVAADG